MKNIVVAALAIFSLSSVQALASDFDRANLTEVRMEKIAETAKVVCEITPTGTPAIEMPSLAERKSIE